MMAEQSAEEHEEEVVDPAEGAGLLAQQHDAGPWRLSRASRTERKAPQHPETGLREGIEIGTCLAPARLLQIVGGDFVARVPAPLHLSQVRVFERDFELLPFARRDSRDVGHAPMGL